MKLLLENWKEFLTEEGDELSEMATAWKKRGLAGPYKLKSGEMGDTLAALGQYVTPEGELPTHFIHFGGITEQDVTTVKKKAASWSNQMVADPKLGPAKSVAGTSRQSKHGPQFKFGVNPRADAKFHTPYGIYAYPLTPSIFRSLSEGTLPFAQNEPFILLFKSTDRAPLIYTSQDIPDDEYREYVERLFSDEMVESERKVRYDRAARKRTRTPAYGNSSPYYPPLDFLRKANQQWRAAEADARPGDVDFADDSPPGDLMGNSLPHPRDLPIVRQTEHETDQHMTDTVQGSYTKTNSAYLWGLVRAAAHEDPIRWNAIMRKLGIGGIVDDLGTGHIHPQEPVQAVFFTKRDPEQNLELVEVLPNTHTKKKIERRSDQAQQREIRDLVKNIVAKVHPDPKFRVTQEFITNLISYVGLRDDDWLFNPSTKTDLRETIISLKEEGLQIITEYIIHSYAKGTLMELSNAKIEWERNMRKLGLLPAQLDKDNHPATAFHYETLKKLRADHKDFRMTPSLSQGVENGEYSARDLAQGSFDEIDKIQQEHAEVLRASYEEAFQTPGEGSDKPPTRAPEDPPVEDLSSLFENKKGGKQMGRPKSITGTN